MSRIPKQQISKEEKQLIPSVSLARNKECISFSFEALETTEYFNLDATCSNWSSELFDMLKIVSAAKKSELLSGRYRNYRVHNHENATPPSKLPDGVTLKECYQIRISKSKGGIHGIFYENIFYVIWLDPLHNMYPDEHYGGLKKIKPPNTCCRDREKTIVDLQEQINQLKDELEFYKEYYSSENHES